MKSNRHFHVIVAKIGFFVRGVLMNRPEHWCWLIFALLVVINRLTNAMTFTASGGLSLAYCFGQNICVWLCKSKTKQNITVRRPETYFNYQLSANHSINQSIIILNIDIV